MAPVNSLSLSFEFRVNMYLKSNSRIVKSKDTMKIFYHIYWSRIPIIQNEREKHNSNR